MNQRYDAWARDWKYGPLLFRRPDRVSGLLGTFLDWPGLRRRLKAIDPMIDVLAVLPSHTVEIISMDTRPFTRLWSNCYRGDDNRLHIWALGNDVIDMVHKATWQTRKNREAAIQTEADAKNTALEFGIEDVAKEMTKVVERGHRAWSGIKRGNTV